MKKFYKSLMLLGLFGFTQLFSQVQQNNSNLGTYPLFSQEQVLTGLFNERSTWIKIPNSMNLGKDNFIQIDYLNTPLILPKHSFITVAFNGSPIESRFISPTEEILSWRIPLLQEKFIEGWNEVKITTRQQVQEEPCNDLYNSADWLKILPSSFVHLDLQPQTPFLLYSYPYPFLNKESEFPVNSVWILPQKPQDFEIKSMLQLASQWGKRLPIIPPINVNFDSSNTPSVNRVLIGALPRWKNLQIKPLQQGNGYLAIHPEQNGQYSLFITGADAVGLSKSVALLGNSNAIEQLNKPSIEITKLIEPTPENGAKENGVLTLDQLGYSKILLAGAFSQSFSFTLTRPIGWPMSLNSSMTLFFKHAAILDQKQSSLTVSINGIPVTSTRLSQQNSDNGELTVPIPRKFLDSNSWKIDIVAFHSIDSQMCEANYTGTVWTLIEGNSTVNFDTGPLAAMPTLQSFPYLTGPTGNIDGPVIVWLPENPSPQLLTLAARIAARASQVNSSNINWQILVGKQLPANVRNSTSIIALGYIDEPARWQLLAKDLWITKTQTGLTSKQEIPFVEKNDNWMSILQAIESPWNYKGVIYVVQAVNDEAIFNLAEGFVNGLESKLQGQVTLIGQDNKPVSLWADIRASN